MIKESYFALDILKLKQVEKNIAAIDQKTTQQIEEFKSKESTSAFQSGLVSNNAKMMSQNTDEYEPEPDINDKASIEDIFAANFKTLRIKLIITELSNNDANKKLRNFVSPIMYQVPALRREFGIFHSALIVGPWYLGELKKRNKFNQPQT